jgi:hypothetical protein
MSIVLIPIIDDSFLPRTMPFEEYLVDHKSKKKIM